ncbi:MAG: hypothetical protein R6W71_03165 [Bacteroidales bacterium]
MMKNITLLTVCLLSVLSWQSCQYDWIDPIEPEIPEVVSFSGDIIQIFNDRNCSSSSCHAAGAVPPDLTPANAYDDLFARNQIDLATPENSKLYTKCAPGGSMNKYCQPGDWEIMLKWIQEGALNN